MVGVGIIHINLPKPGDLVIYAYLLVLGLPALALSAGVALAQPPRCTPVTATHLMATATLTATATTATIIVTTPTILATTVIATGIGTKKNFGVASTGGHCFAQQFGQLGDIRRDPSRLVARETSPLGHRLGLTSLMDGAAPPLPFQFAPLSSSRPKQLG